MQWTTQRPTRANANQWFFVRSHGGTTHEKVVMKEVRDDGKELYLAGECTDGMQCQSYGAPLNAYTQDLYEYCGPITMPPDWREIRKRAYPKDEKFPKN